MLLRSSAGSIYRSRADAAARHAGRVKFGPTVGRSNYIVVVIILQFRRVSCTIKRARLAAFRPMATSLVTGIKMAASTSTSGIRCRGRCACAELCRTTARYLRAAVPSADRALPRRTCAKFRGKSKPKPTTTRGKTHPGDGCFRFRCRRGRRLAESRGGRGVSAANGRTRVMIVSGPRSEVKINREECRRGVHLPVLGREPVAG